MTSPSIGVEVAWATGSVQDVVPLELPDGANAGLAIALSGLIECHGLARESLRAAIRGRLVHDGTPLAAGDRIDLCGPVLIDPKEVRRLRAAARDCRER